MAASVSDAGTSAHEGGATDAVSRYLRGSETCDIELLLSALGPNAELVSPIVGSAVFRGAEDLRVLTAAVYGTLRGLQWNERTGEGRQVVVCGSARVGPFAVHDAMVFDLDENGLVLRVRPHLRPWLGLTALAVAVLPRVGRRPGLVLRALRAGSSPRA